MSIKQMSMTKGRQSTEGEEREMKLAAEDLSDLSLLVPVAASVSVKVRWVVFTCWWARPVSTTLHIEEAQRP